MRRASILRTGLLPVAFAYGLTAEIVASQYGQTTTYAGGSGWHATLDFVAGFALVGVGVASWQLRPANLAGPLAVAAGFVWFAPDWVGWDGGPAGLRSAAMLVAGLWLPLLLHAALVFQQGQLQTPAIRGLIAAIYLEAAVVGIGRALFRDPFADVNCWDNCSDNSFLVHSDTRLAHALVWVDLRFAIAIAVAFGILAAWQLVSMTAPGRRLVTPVLAAGAAVAALQAAHAVTVLRTPLEDPGAPTFAAVFVGRALAVCSVALAIGFTVARAQRARRIVERLAVELAEIPRTGGLEAALARATGDRSLRIVYRLRDAERYVDAHGLPVPTPSASDSRAVTTIVRDGRPVAVIDHDPAVFDDTFQSQIGSAARLAVENERLQAEALAHVMELRESRMRIVEAGDATRQRLERDLHDGAQQRLVALSFSLRVVAAKLGARPDARVAEPLAEADRALAKALAAVRGVANGLFPATLASSGLAYAVEELVELAPIHVDVEAVPNRRLPAQVETAAYGVIREAVENAALHGQAKTVSISASCRSDSLLVEALDDGIGGADPARGVGLLDVSDRVGALGGRFDILSPPGGGTRILAEIPCA